MSAGAPCCMGILNVTPDSFSKDGMLDRSRDALLARVSAMCDEGAGIIDVGAMSTRPGYQEVHPKEELARLSSSLRSMVAAAGHVPISIDSYRSEIADYAISCGVQIVNSVFGVYQPQGPVNKEMLRLVRDAGVRLVLMHNRGVSAASSGPLGGFYGRQPPATAVESIAHSVREDLARQVDIAVGSGVAVDQLMIDPGIGFGITPDESLALLGSLPSFVEMGIPVMISASRKSVVGYGTGTPISDHRRRDAGTHALTALAVAAGVRVIRAHDVAGNVSAIRMAQSVLDGRFPSRDG